MATTTTIGYREGRKVLLDLMVPLLSAHGFRHARDLSFIRDSRDCTELVSFSTRRGSGGSFCFSVGAGVRFPAVEAILQSGAGDDLMPTVGKPLSVLKKGVGFPEWCFDGQRGPVEVISEVILDIESYLLPFLDRYCSINEVAVSLGTDDPKNWFVLSPEERIAVLVAIECVQGRVNEAIQRLDVSILGLKDAPPKKRVSLERLRERLIG